MSNQFELPDAPFELPEPEAVSVDISPAPDGSGLLPTLMPVPRPLADHVQRVKTIAAATLDTPIDLRPEYHIYVRSKASWYDINDGKPQHETTSGK